MGWIGGRYVLPGEPRGGGEPESRSPDLAEVARFLRAAKPAGPHLTVVFTIPGAAQSVGLAIDRAGWPELVGTMAGDDTVFVATAARRATRNASLRRLERLAGGEVRRRCMSFSDPIVLAFSGGLDTSFCIPWLAETSAGRWSP